MKIYTVGGYNEVGKNMTVVETDKDAFIFDCGVHLPPLVEFQEREENGSMDENMLRGIGAIPQDTLLDENKVKGKVRAIFASHAHLDHIGALPYLENRYKAEILGTPFTMQVLKKLCKDEDIKLKNKIKKIQPNSSYKVKGKDKEYKVEFINITHSTLQASLVALHTDEGVILYANDFKLDNSPQLGKKPNYKAIKRLSGKVKALVVESLYAGDERKTPSEKIAKGLLEDVLLGVENENSGIIVTTFSSHIARLKSIVELGKKLGRKVIFVGRSLRKYVSSAIKEDLCPFEDDIEIYSYRKEREKILKKASKNKEDYLVVCTGHQGEPGSILERISRDDLPYNLDENDHVIFSSSTIPAEINRANKAQMEKRLKMKKVRIFDSVHVSGHAGREDLRDFINMVNPEHVIPAHGDLPKISALAELSSEMGYKIGENCHIMRNGQDLEL